MPPGKKSEQRAAKRADRVIAPGDGFAEPGEREPKTNPAPQGRQKQESTGGPCYPGVKSVAPSGLDIFRFISPGSAAPSPGAITLSASSAGWLDGSAHGIPSGPLLSFASHFGLSPYHPSRQRKLDESSMSLPFQRFDVGQMPKHDDRKPLETVLEIPASFDTGLKPRCE
jgi:hypothetical protein